MKSIDSDEVDQEVEMERGGIFKNFKFPLAGWIILIHEVLERFAFYGTKTILTPYINLYLKFSDDTTTIIYHLFQGFAYFSPIIGAIIADNYLGRFKTVIFVGMIYFIGHLIMTLTAISRNIAGPLIGMFVLAFGAGGIKSSIAAFGGDQVPQGNERMVQKYFSIFYTAINLGAFMGTFLTPILRKDVSCVDSQCYPLGFGVPATIFLITYLIFICGKRTYRITESSKNVLTKFVGCFYRAVINFFRERKTKRYSSLLDYAQSDYSKSFIKDCKKAWKIIVIFSPITIFWALYEQQGSRWTLQAKLMDGRLGSFIMKPEQIQAFNPLLIVFLIPFFDFIIYPIFNKLKIFRAATSKLVLAYIITALAFTVTALLQISIMKGLTVDYSVGGSKLSIANQINFCNATINIDSKIHNIVGGKYINLNMNPGNYTMNVQCNNVQQEFNVTLYENKIKSLFIYSNEVDDLNVVLEDVQFNKFLSNGFIRYISNNDDYSANETIVIRRISEKIVIGNNYEDLEVGYYDVLCGKKLVKCNEIEVVPGLVGSIAAIKPNKVSFVKEVEPKLIHMLWQLPQYVMLTCGEILCSITALSLAYTESPDSMKSLMQAVYLFTIFGANIFVALVASAGELMSPTTEFFFFAVLVLIAGFTNWILIKCVIPSPENKRSDKTEDIDLY